MANSSGNSTATLIEGSFCDTYLDVAGTLAHVAAAFLIAGLLVGLGAAVVGLIRGPAKPNAEITKTSDAFLEALKGLIEALAAAPAWLGMFGAGILLFWIIGNVVPENCKALVGQVASKPTNNPAPDKPAEAQATSNSQNAVRP